MEDVRMGFEKALIEGVAYDYICNNYPRFTNDELVTIIKELLFGFDSNKVLDNEDLESIRKDIVEELRDRW